MDKYELQDHPSVIALAKIQADQGLNDNDFARRVRLTIAGSSWGKAKAGTYAGNCDNALAAVDQALAQIAVIGADAPASEIVGTDVLMPHMRAAADAVDIARVTTDEHRLVVLAGGPGCGKSTTGRYLLHRFGGTLIHARPSWSRSYMQTLTEIARGLGVITEARSAGQVECGLINALAISPRLIIIDEANHFSRDALNFLKTILNETKCCIVLLTIPKHLSRMAAEHQEESKQLLRRAVAIIHIPQIGTDDINVVLSGLYPNVAISGSPAALVNLANRMDGMDTVRRVLDYMQDGMDYAIALRRVERDLKTCITTAITA